jgi:ribonuclease HI
MELEIYTDGGCSGNPGPGGWAYVIIGEPAETGKAASADSRIIAEKWGAEKDTTNNRMELSAVIAALEFLPGSGLNPEKITLFTDSQYVQKGITQWIHAWKRNNWRTSSKTPVKNRELWLRLDALSGALPIRWAWVKGHAGNRFNERCDRMTQDAIASLGLGTGTKR